MIRGTTPTISIKLNTALSLDELEEIYVTFENKVKQLTKKKSELTIDDDKKRINFKLSQEETLLFQAGKVKVQLRLLTKGGTAYASTVRVMEMEEILKEGKI